MGKKKQKWRNEEEEALLGGIEKYGLGKWSLILKDPQFDFYLTNRSNIDLKDKWRNLCPICDGSKIKHKVTTLRRNYLMDTPPLSSKKRSKKQLAEDYHNQCNITPQRRGTRSNTINRARKLTSQKVPDNLLHSPSPPISTAKISKIQLVEELSDSEDYRNQCTITPQRKGTRNNTVNQTRKLNSMKVHDNLMHDSPLSSEEISENHQVEELSGSEIYQISCTITRQRRGTRNNMINHARKLNSDKVHSYLENLWRSFPEDKKSSFTHLDPLWYNLYSNDSNKEKVLNWIKKKDVFSRKYVVFPIVQWGHWNVLIFCHFGETLGSKLKTPCILLLDSLEKTDHSKQLEPIIRKFVSDIYKNLYMTEDIKKLRKMPFLVPKVPQQRDDEECGIFVLYYIKLFVENAPESFSISDGYPYFMKKDWFNFEGLDSFCKTLNVSHK